MRFKMFFSVLFCLGCLSSVLWAQQDAPAPSEQSKLEIPPTPQTPERQQFDAQLKVYKENLKKLRDIKEAYQTATPAKKDELFSQYQPLIQETEKLQLTLIPLAINAYNAAPSEDIELQMFLGGMLQWMTVSRENYEVAYAIAKAFFTKPFPEEVSVLYAYAAYAAFNVMELDDAEAWLDIAIEKDVLEKADPQNKMNIEASIRMFGPMYRDLWAKEQTIREKEANENLPRVLLKTTKGDLVIELFLNEAPNAVNNFLTLVSEGFYSDVPFHRVLPFFMAQGGDPTGTGTGGPGYCIPCECSQPNARMHFRGSLSMAHAGLNTGGSQFFLTFVPTGSLNKKHTVFGRVVEGMPVLSEIQRINPEDENQPVPDKIIEATILRGQPGPFEKLPGR